MIRLHEFLTATGGRILGSVQASHFTDLAINPQAVKPGHLFIALASAMPDAAMLAAICQAGAIGIVCQTPPSPLPAALTCILVSDAQQALLDYTRYLLSARARLSFPAADQHPERPTWIEIDLAALGYNVRRVMAIVGPGVEVLAIVKAEGYGHGAVQVARAALENGARWLGVTCLSEALVLRHAGLDAPILILGYTPPWQARDAVLNDVTVTLFSRETALALARAGEELGRPARAHLKVDTGMGRLGLLPGDVPTFVAELRQLSGFCLDGIFTHMAAADDADLSYTCRQLEQFDAVLAALRARDMLPAHIHAANSAALLKVPASRYNMVRLGIAMYGLDPSGEAPCPGDFQPALSFKCQVSQVKELPEGSFISYGCTFRTARPSRIAVIPVGYADGFRRAPMHWGEVLVKGRRAPIVGRVCMDQAMIDVTDIPGVEQGNEVVLIGTQGEERLTVDEVARRLGTVNYEVVSAILARVPRVV